MEPLTLERFRNLADGYGGVIARWPKEYRRLATDLASRPEAIVILAEATALDHALDEWRVGAPSCDFAALVAAAAPASARSLVRRVRLWWTGIGTVFALAGVAAGAATVVMVGPAGTSAAPSTSFGDVAGAER